MKRQRRLWHAGTRSLLEDSASATAGPGAIHLLNGLYDAKMDGASVVAITGQAHHDVIGTYCQQEGDLVYLFSDVAVYNQEVRSPAQVQAFAHEAVKPPFSAAVPPDVNRFMG